MLILLKERRDSLVAIDLIFRVYKSSELFSKGFGVSLCFYLYNTNFGFTTLTAMGLKCSETRHTVSWPGLASQSVSV